MKKSFQDIFSEYGVPFGPPTQAEPIKPLMPQRLKAPNWYALK